MCYLCPRTFRYLSPQSKHQGQGGEMGRETELKNLKLSERNEAGAQAREFWRQRAIDSVVAGEAAKAEHQAQVLDKIEFVAFVEKIIGSDNNRLDAVRSLGEGFLDRKHDEKIVRNGIGA